MNTKHIFPLFLLLVFSVFCFSQEVEEPEYMVDLKHKIEQAADDTEKLQLLDSLTKRAFNDLDLDVDAFIPFAEQTQQLALELENYDVAAKQALKRMYHYNNYVGQPEESLKIFNEMKPSFQNIENKRLIVDFYNDAGASYYYLDEIEKSNEFYFEGLEYAQADSLSRSCGRILLYIGDNYSVLGDFPKSSAKLKEASSIFQEIKDTSSLAMSKLTLATLYSRFDFFKESKKERDEILEMKSGIKEPGIFPGIYFLGSSDAAKQGDYQEQLVQLGKAIEAYKTAKTQNLHKISFDCSLVECYLNLERLQEAKNVLAEVKQYAKDNDTAFRMYNIFKAEKLIAFKEGDYLKAKQFGEKYKEEVIEASDFESIMDAEEFLSKVYHKLGQTDKSYSHFKAYTTIKDSIFTNQKTNALSYYQTLYETEKQDTKIKEQQANISLLKTKNKLRNRQLIFGLLGALSLFGLIYLYRSRRFAIAKQEQQRQFAQDLIRSTEQERKRISSDLHDSIGQSLLLIKNKILLNPNEVKDDISLVDDAIHEVRSISQALHPYQFESLGLLKSLEYLVNQFQANSDTFYSSDIEVEAVDLPENISIFVYRIMQEALNNVEKHANALACNLSVRKINDGLEFQVRDNGVGFDLTENSQLLNSLGMKTLKERAQIIGGQLTIESTKNSGTIVNLKVPTL